MKPCRCAEVTLFYLVPVAVTVDLDLEAVLSVQVAGRGDPAPRSPIDEHHRRAQQIADTTDWPDWR